MCHLNSLAKLPSMSTSMDSGYPYGRSQALDGDLDTILIDSWTCTRCRGWGGCVLEALVSTPRRIGFAQVGDRSRSWSVRLLAALAGATHQVLQGRQSTCIDGAVHDQEAFHLSCRWMSSVDVEPGDGGHHLFLGRSWGTRKGNVGLQTGHRQGWIGDLFLMNLLLRLAVLEDTSGNWLPKTLLWELHRGACVMPPSL